MVRQELKKCTIKKSAKLNKKSCKAFALAYHEHMHITFRYISCFTIF